MRNLKSYIGLSFVMALGLMGCQDDFDNPALVGPQATLEANTTILDLKNKYWNVDDADYTDAVSDDYLNYIAKIGKNDDGSNIVIKGRVISSDREGNIYKNLVIQDETAALTISVNQSGLYNNFRVGQEVVINATDLCIGKYNGLQQLGNPDYSDQYGWQASFMPFALFQEHVELNGLPDMAQVDTINTTLDEILSVSNLTKWQSQLIRLNNVRFEDGKGDLCYTDGSEISSNRTIYDENGNSIIVRNSGYATFWSDKLPADYGDVVGILSYYGSSGWQLLLRSPEDCFNFGNPTINPGTEKNPYTVPQAIEKQGSGVSGWVTGYIVGAVAPGVETIASNEDIEWTAPSTLNNTLVIAPAADVKDIAQCLVISLPADSKLREVGNLRDNAGNLGKQIWLLGKFEQYMGANGITGNRGTTSEFSIDGVEISDGTIPNGEGTEAAPYSVAQVKAGQSGTGVWIAGYIVGWVDGMTLADGATFTANSTSRTNVLIANTPTASTVDECIPVQLPTGIRDGINLSDNPGNFGKKLSIKGDITTYFGATGVKNGTEYKLDGEGSGSDTPSTPVDPVTSLNETFEGITSLSQLTGWKTKVVAGNKDWYFTSFDNNTYAACTAYKGTDPTDGSGYDSWLITPPLNIDGMASKNLSFESQAAYSGGEFEVYAMTTDDPATATLTKLNCTLATPPASGYSGFVASGDISLAQFSGTIYIGFRYTATTSASSMTFCIDNVKAGEGGSAVDPGEDETPDTPETPVTGNAADFNTMNGGEAKSTYGTYTSTAGWTATNCCIQRGLAAGEKESNPKFAFLGNEKTFAVCINGKTSAPGSLVSPTIAGGIKTLSFKYGFAFTDTKCNATINIKQNGEIVKTETLNITEVTKFEVKNFSLDVNVTGDFVIEIVNNCASGVDSNKDRISVWDLTWTN